MKRIVSFFEDHSWVGAAVILGGFLVLGLIAFKDYGIAWDEPVQREYGSQVYGFVAHHDQTLLLNRHRFYGPAFELLFYSLERALGLTDTRAIYMMRHLANFLVLWLGVVFFYLVARYVLRSWKAGLLGSLFLILSPRIFAHGFYNSKDVPLLSMFVIGAYSMLRYLDAKTLRWAVVHGVVCGILVDTRIVGALVLGLTLAFWGYETIMERGRSREGEAPLAIRRTAWSLLAYLLTAGGVMILLWPTLWRDPVGNLVQALQSMRSFPWEATVLYLGKYIWSTKLPWHYTFVWIGISTPLAYILLFLVGLAKLVDTMLVSRKSQKRGDGAAIPKGRFPLFGREAALVLVWFFLPLLYFMASRAVLYDEWRHSFFVYPAFLLVALAGLLYIWDLFQRRLAGALRRAGSALLVLLVAASLGSTASFMLRHHPFENVYFNSLVGGVRGASGRFEMDYWGLSYRKGLEYILGSDGGQELAIFTATPPGRYNADILASASRKRLAFISEPTAAKYYITNFRWDKNKFPPESEVFSVKVDGAKLMAVYRL